VGAINKISKASSKLEQEHEREATPAELSKLLDIPEDRISSSMSISGKQVSYDAPFVSGEQNGLLDVLINPDAPVADTMLMHESLQQEIYRSLSTLAEREREVLILFYGIGMSHALSLQEIALKFDLTRERVRQIKEKAIRRLKHKSRSGLLKAYLG
jgi:RNA polymerase primary sigma factor